MGIAQLNLARAYKDGAGVKKDLAEAYAWFTLAAGNGYADGLSYRARIAEDMNEEDLKRGERLIVEHRKARPSKESK